MMDTGIPQTELHRIVLDARDAERAALARLASMKPGYFVNAFSAFVPIRHGDTAILANLKDMEKVSTSLDGSPRSYSQQFSARYRGTAFSPDGNKFQVEFTVDHDAGVTATRHHIIDGVPARKATVIDLRQRAESLDTMIGLLEKSGFTGELLYSPSIRTGGSVVPADPYKQEAANCFAIYLYSTDEKLRRVADYPTREEAFRFMRATRAIFHEYSNATLDVKCTSVKELAKLSRDIKEMENAMSAQNNRPYGQQQKPHFNNRTANQLARQLRDGAAPLQRQGVQEIPYNPATGRAFHGINAMSLMMQGRKDDRWFSFEDAAACGYKVKNGEKGTPVQKWPGKKPGETMNKAITTYVFNAEQLDRVPPRTRKPERPDPVERVTDLLKNSGVAVVHDQTERSFYAPSKDEIHLPRPENCAGRETYCEMALYEYFKATGHPSRQARETWNAVGASDRAREELICATATMTMCAEMGIPHDPARNPELALDWAKSMERHPLDFARDMHQADIAVFATLRQERAKNTEIGFQSSEPWRPVPEASPLMAVQTFTRQNEAVERAKTEPEKLHFFEYNNREIFALPDTGLILGKKGDLDDNGRVEMKVKTEAYGRDGDTYSVIMNYAVQRNENGLAALTEPARAEEIQPSTKTMALPIDWDGTLEVRGCADDMDGSIRSDVTDPEEIQFYGVYANTRDGLQYHVADFDAREAANAYTRLVNMEYNRQMHIKAGQERPRAQERDTAAEPSRADPPEPAAPQRDSEEARQPPKGYVLDDEQEKALYDKAREHVEKRDGEIKAEHDKAARRLKSQIKRFEIPKEPTPYMKANDIQLHPGVYQNGNSTCIPLYNNNGEMRSMAYVQEDGATRYAKNGDRQGCHHIIGGQDAMKKAPVAIIANEYATAAATHESVGMPVMACMGKDNIVDAVKQFRAANPDKPILIAADRNAEHEVDLTLESVEAAVVFPKISNPEKASEVNTFNDLARAHGDLGKDAVKSQLQPVIDREIDRKAEKAKEQEAKVEKKRDQKELARA